MFLGGGLLGAIVLFLWIYCILDVIATDESNMRHLPKLVWLILVVLLPLAGAIAWFVLGRQPGGSLHLGRTQEPRSQRRPSAHPSAGHRPRALPRGPKGPEDSPEFMAALEERKRRELERRREELGKPDSGEDGEPL